MDPITLIASAPPEWIPGLIVLAIAYKAWTFWLDKRTIKRVVAEEVAKEPDTKD
jgi:hypothetical protein